MIALAFRRAVEAVVRRMGWPEFLRVALTSTSWDGAAYSTTSATLIDLNSVFGVPRGVKAVLAGIAIRDSGSLTSRVYAQLGPANGQWALAPETSGLPIDSIRELLGIVPCDSDGNIYYSVTASGVGTMDIWIKIWGYWR